MVKDTFAVLNSAKKIIQKKKTIVTYLLFFTVTDRIFQVKAFLLVSNFMKSIFANLRFAPLFSILPQFPDLCSITLTLLLFFTGFHNQCVGRLENTIKNIFEIRKRISTSHLVILYTY